MRLAAVIILYNPPQSVWDNLKSYSGYVQKLFIINNSDKNISLPESPLGTEFMIVNHQENLGVAAALNKGICLAKEEDYEWILTMDQDSRFPQGMFKTYLDFILDYPALSQTGIFGPEILEYEEKGTEKSPKATEETLLITSGNIINIKAWEKAGYFNELLFIDEVDHDFCLRVLLSGYKVIKVNGIYLQHSLGKNIYVSKKGHTSRITLHSPFRIYYIVRNGLFLANKYNKSFPGVVKERRRIILITLKNNLLYNSERWKVIYYSIRGMVDFFRNSFGKFKN